MLVFGHRWLPKSLYDNWPEQAVLVITSDEHCRFGFGFPAEIIIEETNRVKIPTWEAKLREILFKPVSPPLSTKGREGSGAG